MATYNQMVVRVSVCDPQGELLPALSELALFYDNSTECHPERSSYGEFDHWCLDQVLELYRPHFFIGTPFVSDDSSIYWKEHKDDTGVVTWDMSREGKVWGSCMDTFLQLILPYIAVTDGTLIAGVAGEDGDCLYLYTYKDKRIAKYQVTCSDYVSTSVGNITLYWSLKDYLTEYHDDDSHWTTLQSVVNQLTPYDHLDKAELVLNGEVVKNPAVLNAPYKQLPFKGN